MVFVWLVYSGVFAEEVFGDVVVLMWLGDCTYCAGQGGV